MAHIDSTGLIKDNESPFDFINKNMERMEAKKAAFQAEGKLPDKLPDVLQPNFRSPQTPQVEEATPVESPESTPATGEEEARVETLPSREDAEIELNLPEESIEEEPTIIPEKPKKDKDTNMKALRVKAEELERRNTENETRLNRILSGEEELPTVAELKAKNKDLERYQKLHDLKMSDEYHSSYVEPLTKIKDDLLGLAKDYQVNPVIFKEAIGLKSKAELDRYLGKFFTPAGALDARQKIEQFHELNAAAAKADREPEEALANLRQEYNYQKQQKAISRVQNITKTAQTAWVKAATTVRQEEGFTVFNKTGDPENDKISDDLMSKAAKDLGVFTTFLASKGLEELPEEQAEWLYKTVLMGYGAPILAKSLEAHYNRAEEVVNTNKRQQPFRRPGIGATQGNSRGENSSEKQPMSNKTAAQKAMQSVGIKI
jgi:hypothetical protein